MKQAASQHIRKISLEDKYTLEQSRAYMTGVEALVRLPMLQHQRDVARGLNTAGFVSGYRGSPLGGVDQAMWQADHYLKHHQIHFQPGINEDLAATAVWGSQQTNLFSGARYDGVFGLWYGKGPGVDRSMDVLKHANAFGTESLWWCIGCRRRRSRLQIFHAAPPIGAHVYRRIHTDTRAGKCTRGTRSRHLWMGTLTLLRVLGWL
jgi:hypothetical protein